jgi:hypothetical protein
VLAGDLNLRARKPDDGKIKISQSQITSFICQRAWGLKKIDGLEDDDEIRAFGRRGHKSIEDWLGKGIPIDLTTPHGEAAIAGLHHWPDPLSPGMWVEYEMAPWEPEPGEGYYWHGVIDLLLAGQGPGGVLQVGLSDHKFVGDFAYALSPEELATDPQGCLYAHWAFTHFPELTEIPLRWIYYRRNKPYKSMARQVTVTREIIAPTVQVLKQISREIRDVRIAVRQGRITTGMQLPPNASQCGKYRGCKFIPRCNLSAFEKSESLMENANDILARINAARTQQQGGPVAPPPGVAAGLPALPAQAQPTALPAGLPALPGVSAELAQRMQAQPGAPGLSLPAGLPGMPQAAVLPPVVPLQAAGLNPPEAAAGLLPSLPQGAVQAVGQEEKPKAKRGKKAAAATAGAVETDEPEASSGAELQLLAAYVELQQKAAAMAEAVGIDQIQTNAELRKMATSVSSAATWIEAYCKRALGVA